MKTKKAIHGSVVVAGMVTLAMAVVGAFAACGYGGPVCSVIDLADKACPLVVQFTDDAGKQQTMQITHQDARELGARKAAAKAEAESKSAPDAASRWQ